jgi:hypothetical protein
MGDFMKIIKDCKECGNTFESYKSHKRKYCSGECSNKGAAKTKKAKRSKLICQICGKEYTVIPYRADKSKTCSFNCKQKYAARQQETNRIKVICHNCNNEYEIWAGNTASKYCDINCKAEHQKETMIGEGNNNFGKFKYSEDEYKDWQDYKKLARSRSYSNYNLHKDEINPDDLPSGINKYHLDHRYSIHDGFHNTVPIELIADKKNLQVLSANENLKKGTQSDIRLSDLMRKEENIRCQ